MIQVDPKNLPPTSAAAKFHSCRVFLQINQWKNSDCNMMPESWGWPCTESGLIPILTDQPPAPEELLKIIRCNCSGDCSSAKCSCKNHSLKCSIACGQCCRTAHGWSIWPPGQRSMTVAATYTMQFQLPHMINIQKKVNLFWSAF